MTAATALLDAPGRASTRPGVRVSEPRTSRAAVALIALHIVDDEFLQPPPGTPVHEHVPALLPIGAALAAAWPYPPLHAGLRAGIAPIFGILSIVAGMLALGNVSAGGVSAATGAASSCPPTGLMVIALAA